MALMSLLFVALTIPTLGVSSIWFDEAFGAYLIRYSYVDIVYYTGMDVHPPLYYWALKTWSLVFGTSDVALRSMSVLFGVVTIILGYLLVRRLFGRRSAIYAVAVLVVSPMFIRYGQEMRMYTMVTAIALSATYALVVAMERSTKKAWATYGGLLAVGMLTHYLIALVWLSHWVWRAVVVRHKTLRTWRKRFFSREWIGAHVLAVVLFLPWMYWFVKRIIDVQTNGFWIPPLSPVTLPNYMSNLLFYQNAERVSPWLTLVLLLLILTVPVLVYKVWTSLNKQHRRDYLLLASIAVVPVGLLVVLSLPPLESSFVDRYIMPSIVATALFVGVTLAAAPKRLWRLKVAIIALLVVSVSFGIVTVYQEGNYNKFTGQSSHAKQLIELIRASDGAADPIIADSPWLYYEAAQYSTLRSPVYFLDEKTEYRYGSLEMLRQNDTGKIKHLDTFMQTHASFWYIGRPGEGEITRPTDGITELARIRINDHVTGEPAYEAVRYRSAVIY